MCKAVRKLSKNFPKMLHFTCLAHDTHQVAEEVKENYETVHALISNMKKVFLKAPTRVKTFKLIVPDLPPQPILT